MVSSLLSPLLTSARRRYDRTLGPPNVTLDESVTEFSMWAILASPMLFTTPIMNCTTAKAPAAAAPAPAVCSVKLLKQLSHVAKCIAGKSFGCDGDESNTTMWIDAETKGSSQGCRGIFECDGVSNVRCDTNTPAGGNPHHVCRCSATPPGPPGPPGPPPSPFGPSSPPMTPKHCVGYLNDVQKMILLNREVIAINQDVATQGFPAVPGDSTVWSRNLSDGSIAVAFYNENDAPRSIGTSFAALGWAASAKASVRDLWAHTDNGTATGAVTNVTVRAHATVVLRLTPLKTTDAITLDPSATADRFDGIGGVSGGGGGTRLLYDYAPAERSAILDLLFKPKHGAALHVLKVGIGPDGDTTQGSEASHMRTIDDRSPTAFDRGYENWFMAEAKARNDKIHLSGLEWGVPGWVTQWWKNNATAATAAATIGDGTTEAATDECSPMEAAQQWTFNYKALGQLCNGHKQCLNVKGCDAKKPIILFQPSFPGSSCVKKCGCTPVKGKTCNKDPSGPGPQALDCNTNEEFELAACDAPAGCPITNAIDLSAIVERADGSIVLKSGGHAKPAGDPWIYNSSTQHLKNSRTGNCLGRWQNPPPGPPSPALGHHATVSTQHNIEYLIRWVKGLKEKKNLTIDSIGLGYNEGPYNTTWIKLAKKAFVAAGLADLKTIGTDDCCGGEYRVVAEMKKDAELMGAIDILGAHW